MFKIWYYLDEGLNRIANYLYYNSRIKWLANHCQSNIADSDKDRIIYSEIEEKFAITPFERKIIENEAYRDDFVPNTAPILKARTSSLEEEARQKFIKEVNLDTDELLWSTEEIILLHNYKNDMHNAGLNRIYNILNYYHKQHFLMSIGVRSWER